MKLRGIEFEHFAFNASGGRNFTAKDTWWFHHAWNLLVRIVSFITFGLWKIGALLYKGCVFVTKTITYDQRLGNMPLRAWWPLYLIELLVLVLTFGFVRIKWNRRWMTTQPRELFPKCVVVLRSKDTVLNNLGWSCPGADFLMQMREWFVRTEPYIISFGPLGDTPQERNKNMQDFVTMLKSYLPEFRAKIALEINDSCPNVGVCHQRAVEICGFLDIAATLGIPVGVKVSVEMDPDTALIISRHPACDFLTCSNTVPWGHLPDRIHWKEIFGTDESPLKHLGGRGGGLSGRELLPLVVEWIQKVRAAGVTIPIIGGGGILCWQDAKRVFDAGANAIFVGCASMLHPDRVQSIIDFANEYGAMKEREACQQAA